MGVCILQIITLLTAFRLWRKVSKMYHQHVLVLVLSRRPERQDPANNLVYSKLNQLFRILFL